MSSGETANRETLGGMAAAGLATFLVWAAATAVLAAGCSKSPPRPDENLVWPPPPNPARIQWIEAIGSSADLGRSWFADFIDRLAGSQAEEHLVRPYGIAVGPEGRVFVTDIGLGKVFVFDKKAGRLSFLGAEGQGKLVVPTGIAVDSKGRAFVADTRLNRVIAFGPSGEVALSLGEDGSLEHPSAVAIDEERGRLYVTSTYAHEVRVFDLEGHPLGQFGSRGTGPGEFNFPAHIAVDRKGWIYVTDEMNFRIQVFDKNWTFQREFGKPGIVSGSFSRPKGVAVDSEGHVYVVDSLFHLIQIFSETGELLVWFGSNGHGNGEFHLPANVAIDGSDRIYVTDQYNRRYQVFQYLPEPRPSAE